MKNARDMNSPPALPLPSELSPHPWCNGGLLPWSHSWFLLCCHLQPLYMSGPIGEPGPALGVGPGGLPQPLPCPLLLGLSQGLTSSFHFFSAKQSWSIQSPTAYRPCPTAGTWAACPPALPAMVARTTLRPQQPLWLCTCSPSGFIKSLLIVCVSSLSALPGPPQVFILSHLCFVAVTGRDTVGVNRKEWRKALPLVVGITERRLRAADPGGRQRGSR